MVDRTALYVSNGPELTHWSVDIENATLTRHGSVTLPANVHYAWPHASGRYLYVASSDQPRLMTPGGDTHHVTALSIDPASGALAPHGAPIALPVRPIHLTTDIPSAHLLVAFSNPAALRVYGINDDGTPGAEVEQDGPVDAGIYPHQVRVSPDNQLAILVTRGNDASADAPEDPGALKVFRYDDGRLTPGATVAPGGGYGFGPRHLDFHPTQPWLYASLERQNELQAFAYDGDGVAVGPAFRRPTLLEPGPAGVRQLGGTVHVHPKGHVVYVANRASLSAKTDQGRVFTGGENNFAVFAIDPATGEPTLLQHVDTEGFHCRTFHIDPSGRLLFAANLMPMLVEEGGGFRKVSPNLAVFRIAEDGRLSFVRKYDLEVGPRALFWIGMLGG